MLPNKNIEFIECDRSQIIFEPKPVTLTWYNNDICYPEKLYFE